MYAACQNLVSGSLDYATDIMGDFLPLLVLLGGISIAMWVLPFIRDFVGGHN